MQTSPVDFASKRLFRQLLCPPSHIHTAPWGLLSDPLVCLPPPAPPARAAPKQRHVLTPEAVQDFEMSRKELLTPQPSITEVGSCTWQYQHLTGRPGMQGWHPACGAHAGGPQHGAVPPAGYLLALIIPHSIL